MSVRGDVEWVEDLSEDELMGRTAKEVDMEAALDLIMRGESVPSVAKELGVSPPTLRARMNQLTEERDCLIDYRKLHSLQLTGLIAYLLEAITPDKIENASLKDLVQCYKILKEKELLVEGKPSEIKSLVAHLIYIEKQEQAAKTDGGPVQDAEFEESEEGPSMDNLPATAQVTTLAQLDRDEF